MKELGRFSGSLRWRYFGDIPLVEDDSVVWGSTLLVDFYASRLPGEPSAGVEDVHFHPMEPRSARLTLGWRF